MCDLFKVEKFGILIKLLPIFIEDIMDLKMTTIFSSIFCSISWPVSNTKQLLSGGSTHPYLWYQGFHFDNVLLFD